MEHKKIDINEKTGVRYCIEMWQRDHQIALAIERCKKRIAPCYDLRPEPIALVAFGPSLADTWEKIKDFKYVMTCSGAHRMLIDRGIIPQWHVAVDPLPGNTPKLIGEPHPDVEYLIASTCHQDVHDHLENFNMKLWHVFANEDDALRTLPNGEWALTGGCSVGLRMMTIARFFGFREHHIFGMDGGMKIEKSHAGDHPAIPKKFFVTEYEGETYFTTPGYLEAAKQTFHELDQMPDVKATFYGEGLVQDMAKHYKPNPVAKEKAMIGYNKPELASAEYIEQNRQLHRANAAYGIGGSKHAELVKQLVKGIVCDDSPIPSVLDYGAGKGYLAKNLPFPIAEYDPAITGKTESPKPADLVICTDVLEHIEPDKLIFVLNDLRRCVKKVGYFTIHTGPAIKHLPDGRNTHLIQKDEKWWRKNLDKFFQVAAIQKVGPELHVTLGPKGTPLKLMPMQSSQTAVNRAQPEVAINGPW